MKIDLHAHSFYSDGTLPPRELIDGALAAGVKLFSITDHDTVEAYTELPPGKYEGMTLISGCEFSSQWKGCGIHILGLNMDLDAKPFRTLVERQQLARQNRAEKISTVLEKYGIENSLEGAAKIAGVGASGKGVIGRPHFAQFLVETGAVKSDKEAFKKYLGKGKPGDIKTEWPEISAIVDAINASGGVSVIAHPLKYDFTRTKLRALIDDFVAAGGSGIELISGNQPSNQTQQLAELVSSKGLLASAGSDFHRPGQPWAALGKVAALPSSVTPIWAKMQAK